MMYLVEGRNPKETRGQYVLTKESAYAILEEMKQDFLKVNIYEKENGEYKRIEKYEREQTEREYLNSLSDEEFAEWILDVSDECFDCGKSDNGDCPFGKAQGVCTCINKDSVVKWLKQPRRE